MWAITPSTPSSVWREAENPEESWSREEVSAPAASYGLPSALAMFTFLERAIVCLILANGRSKPAQTRSNDSRTGPQPGCELRAVILISDSKFEVFNGAMQSLNCERELMERPGFSHCGLCLCCICRVQFQEPNAIWQCVNCRERWGCQCDWLDGNIDENGCLGGIWVMCMLALQGA